MSDVLASKLFVDNMAPSLWRAVEWFGEDSGKPDMVLLDPRLILAVAGVMCVNYERVSDGDVLDVRLLHQVLQDVLADADVSGSRYGWLLLPRGAWPRIAMMVCETYEHRLPLWRKLHPIKEA